MTKSIGILVGIFLMKILVSCCGADDCCDGCCDDCCNYSGERQDLHIDDLSLTNAVLDDGGLDMLDVSIPVDYTSLRIALTLDIIEEIEFTVHSAGVPSAPPCGSPRLSYLLDQVVEFTITSNQDYYSYEAGESLNEIFRFGNDLDADNYQEADRFRFNSYSYNEISYFSLIIPPDSSGEYVFTFSLVLNDGREFTLIADPITITS